MSDKGAFNAIAAKPVKKIIGKPRLDASINLCEELGKQVVEIKTSFTQEVN